MPQETNDTNVTSEETQATTPVTEETQATEATSARTSRSNNKKTLTDKQKLNAAKKELKTKEQIITDREMELVELREELEGQRQKAEIYFNKCNKLEAEKLQMKGKHDATLQTIKESLMNTVNITHLFANL